MSSIKNVLSLTVATLAGVSLAIWAMPAPANACSCIKRSPAEYVASADQVFVGWARTKQIRGGKEKQTYQVVEAIKGKLGPFFEITRPAGASMCGASHKPGTGVLVFVTKGKTQLCSGNYALSYLLQDRFADYLSTGGPKLGAVSSYAFKAALWATLKPYLHKRKVIHAVYAPLAGQHVTIDGTRFEFAKKAPAGKAPFLLVKTGISRVYVSFVDFTFAAEGLSVQVLVDTRKPTAPTVFGQSVVER